MIAERGLAAEQVLNHTSCFPSRNNSLSTVPAAYQQLTEELRSIAILRSCSALLGWDEQTYLPPQGAEHRADQLALLAGMTHERATSEKLGELLQQTSAAGLDTESREAANVREAQRSFQRSARLPRRLVEELSRVTTLAQQAWIDARKAQNFAQFQPWLEKMVALKREEAAALGSETGLAYDALIEDYEPGATVESIQAVFAPFRVELVKLVTAIRESGVEPQPEILTRRYPVDTQQQLGRSAAEQIGFSFAAGRLDVSAHPFCSGIGPGDCRLTTRYDEHHFPGAFFGTLHEAGHGIYEQGLRHEDFGLASGEACSLGIHESQSRMWENFVGRSRAFWTGMYPQVKQTFPDALADVSLDQFYATINDVRPSWIRVEADEVTYNLHIMLRFELEQALIGQSLEVADLPDAWNAAFQRDFGMTPPNDSLGCLQDVHWSAGLFGYFPTYSLGNMYAAQFFERAQQDLGDLSAMFARGEFQPLKEWLNTEIHQHGRHYRAPVLVERVTGQPLTSEPLLRHLTQKFGELYRLS